MGTKIANSDQKIIVGDTTLKPIYRVRKGSLSRKLMFWLAFITLIVMVVFGTINYFIFVNQLNQDLEDRLEEDNKILGEDLKLHLWNLDTDSVKKVSDSHLLVKSFSLLRVSNNFGDLVYEVNNMEEGKEYALKKEVIFYEDADIGTIEITASKEHIEVAKGIIIRSTFFIILAVFFTVLIISFFISRSISLPIKKTYRNRRIYCRRNFRSNCRYKISRRSWTISRFI